MIGMRLRLYTMKKRTTSRLCAIARLFIACTTILLLTSTVMQVEDRDGYQATHLLFMPRETWEMDEARGMLHDEEYYREIDLEEFAADVIGIADFRGSDLYQQAESVVNISSRGNGNWFPHPHAGPVIMRRSPHSPAPPGNEVPVVQAFHLSTPNAWQPLATLEDSPFAIAWQADVPSPPPRRS